MNDAESTPVRSGEPTVIPVRRDRADIAALPGRLDRDGIAARIPHAGTMCLLDRLDAWDATRIACAATNHRDPAHPLRTRSGLLATAAIEYAAQAMALHGALLAEAAGAVIAPGYLASARGVRCEVLRLDDLPAPVTAPDELAVEAVRQAGDARQILYAFRLGQLNTPLVEGR